jgi:hypothetical protein
VHFATVEGPAGSAVRLGKIPSEGPAVADSVCARLREFTNADRNPGTDVDGLRVVIFLHDADARIGAVIGIQKLPRG